MEQDDRKCGGSRHRQIVQVDHVKKKKNTKKKMKKGCF